MRIWLYGRDQNTVQALFLGIGTTDTVIGVSVAPPPDGLPPQSGLTQAMCAAIRGELDTLLIFERRMLGSTPQQMSETEKRFQDYGVTVKSLSSNRGGDACTACPAVHTPAAAPSPSPPRSRRTPCANISAYRSTYVSFDTAASESPNDA